MSFTIEDMILIAEKRYEMKFLAGKNGWANSISWVHLLEGTTIIQNFWGKELAVTTGLGFPQKEDWMHLARQLNQFHASGLIINVGQYIEEVPKELIAYCDENDLPLLTVPWEVHLSDMIKDFSIHVFLQDNTDEQIASALIKVIETPEKQNEYRKELLQHFDVDGSFQVFLLARKLLAEAGYENGEGFPVVEYLYNTSDAHKAVAEALQSMWENELGVTVTLNNQEWAAFLQTRKDGDYSIARNSWIADYNDPMSFLDMWLTGGGNNDCQYSNSDYDSLIAQAKAETDTSKRMELLHQAEDKLVGEDSVLAPIYFYTQKYMLADGIKGLYCCPLGYFFFGYTHQ